MARFVLRFSGSGAKPIHDVEQIRVVPGVRVLDETSGRMLLVEVPEENALATEQSLRSLLAVLGKWILVPEASITIPDPRPKPRRDVGYE